MCQRGDGVKKNQMCVTSFKNDPLLSAESEACTTRSSQPLWRPLQLDNFFGRRLVGGLHRHRQILHAWKRICDSTGRLFLQQKNKNCYEQFQENTVGIWIPETFEYQTFCLDFMLGIQKVGLCALSYVLDRPIKYHFVCVFNTLSNIQSKHRSLPYPINNLLSCLGLL